MSHQNLYTSLSELCFGGTFLLNYVCEPILSGWNVEMYRVGWGGEGGDLVLTHVALPPPTTCSGLY
jgi:hypothetical protein